MPNLSDGAAALWLDGYHLMHLWPLKTTNPWPMYRVDGVNVAQETQRNWATAKYVAWPSCAWLLLSFFPFPVRHPLHPLCTDFSEGNNSNIILWFPCFPPLKIGSVKTFFEGRTSIFASCKYDPKTPNMPVLWESLSEVYGVTHLLANLGWLWFGRFHHLARMLSQICQFPISPGRTRQV